MLVIGTYGLSAYRLDLTELSVDVPTAAAPSSGLTFAAVYPSPAIAGQVGEVWLSIGSSSANQAGFSLTDASGRLITTASGINLKAGINSLNLSQVFGSLPALRKGYYFIRVYSGNQSAVKRLLIV